ncbi:MAG TPA: EamA family transporter [Alphaproteobacteria bacterium]|nr:EamA family transporter [Alphaproteobacteria bacterium]
MSNPQMQPIHWLVVLVAGTLFGSSFLFVNIAVTELPPLSLAAGRALLAVPIAYVVMRAAGFRLPPPGRAWVPLILLGFLTAAIPYSAIAWGQRHIPSGLGGILFGAIPIFSLILTPLFLRDERVTAARVAGAVIGFGGVVLVIGPEALAGIDQQILGAGVTLAAAFSYAAGAIYARTCPDLHPVVMTAGQLVVGSVVMLIAALVVDAPWTLRPSAGALGALAGTAVVGTALPTILLFWLVRQAGPGNASLVTFVMPVVAVALGAAALGERLPLIAFAGLGLILIGAAAIGGRLKPRAKALAGPVHNDRRLGRARDSVLPISPANASGQ